MKCLITILLLLIATGCGSLVTRDLRSKSDALRYGKVYRDCVQLPSQPTGTGLHDFYNLLARYEIFGPTTYLVGIATVGDPIHQAGVNLNDTNALPIHSKGQKSAVASKASWLEAALSRDQVESAVTNGARFTVDPSSNLSFTVPPWMFEALLDLADRHDKGLKRRKEIETQRAAIEYEKRQRRQLYVDAHPGLSGEVKQAILQGKVRMEMTQDDVMVSWGKPDRSTRTVTALGTSSMWHYGDTTVFFQDGKVSGWHERGPP